MRISTTGSGVLGAILAVVLSTPWAAAENLLSDPGFELSTPNGTFPNSGYWKKAWLGTSGAVCTTTAAYTGSSGLWEYTGSVENSWWSGQYQDVAAVAGDVFAASAAVRSQSSWVGGSKALVRISFLDASRSELVSKDSHAVTSGASPWQQLSVQSDAAPAGTAYVRVRLYLEKPNGSPGQTIANFDDCSLEKIVVAKPVLSVTPTALGYGSDLTTLSFDIRNAGSGTLSWSLVTDVPWASVSVASGATTAETDTVTVTVGRTGLTLPAYEGAVTVTSDGGTRSVALLLETASTVPVPSQPAVVTVNGSRLMVQRRLPDGTLDTSRPYTIKGAAWAPTGIGTLSDVTSRRVEFGNWYRLDIQLLRAMNANTVYLFLDPGTTSELITRAREVLDYCYRNGIMVIMTVDTDGSDDTANITSTVAAFKNHPAILMWALGNEWNLWRPDRPLYYGHYATLAAAAAAMQTNALQVKSLDASHPVASILGEINYPTPDDVHGIVNDICTAVDVWGANIYRGPEFYALFSEWQAISNKPLFLSEFGTDAFHTTSWWPPVGAENGTAQANYLDTLWRDIVPELSASDSSKACLGGTVFEWADEWWKTSTGDPAIHDSGGYETTWNAIAHPDGFANEEWFGLVSVDRDRRLAYYVMQSHFSDGECAEPDSTGNWCDDGLFCNGTDICDRGSCVGAGAPPCGDSNECTDDVCVEASDTCKHEDNSSCGTRLRDYSGDFTDDVLLQNTTTAGFRLFLFANSTSVANASLRLPGAGGHDWKPVGEGDFDGDARTDVLLRRSSTGDWRVAVTNGFGPAVVKWLGLYKSSGWELAAVGDCDGDWTEDVVLRNSVTGAGRVFFIRDAAVYSNSFTALTPALNWQVVGTGDFDGDGVNEILQRRATTGGMRVVYVLPGVTPVVLTTLAAPADSAVAVACVGDLDGDGVDDILTRRQTDNTSFVLTMKSGQVSSINQVALNRARAVQKCDDYDGDGVDDVLMRDTATGLWSVSRFVDGKPVAITPAGLFKDAVWQLVR